jgi:hypothetical protein
MQTEDTLEGAPSTTVRRQEVEDRLAEIDRLIGSGRQARQEEVMTNLRPEEQQPKKTPVGIDLKAGSPEDYGPSFEEATRSFRTPTTAEKERAAQVKYTIDRTSEAKELLSQSNRFGRLMSSPVGTTVKRIWTTSKDFRQAFDEITLLYANKPKERESAHAILFAIELSAKKSTDIPKAGE